MPRLTFPITGDGLSLDVRVNLDGASLAALLVRGLPIPFSIEGRGLLDTGSDITAVAPSILQQLNLPVYAHRKTHGIGGPVQVRLFLISLFILDAAHPHLPWLTLPSVMVMELPSALPVDVLIGMDVVRTCQLFVDGPAAQFTLDF